MKGFNFDDSMKLVSEGECQYKIIEVDNPHIEPRDTLFYNNEPWFVWSRHENKIEIRRAILVP